MDGGWPRIADPRRHEAHPLKHGGGRAGSAVSRAGRDAGLHGRRWRAL